MNDIMIFENTQFGELRTALKEGEPWFVAADVCRALELSDTSMTVSRLDADERATSPICTRGGTQQVTIINEPGLYSLVLGSRKPEARAFKRWITHDVIPALRKTGTYTMPTAPTVPTTPPNQTTFLIDIRMRQAELLYNVSRDNRLSRELVEELTIKAAQVCLGESLNYQQKPVVPALPPPPSQNFHCPNVAPNEKLYKASEIAKEAGCRANIVGMTASKHGLKTPEYGVYKPIYDYFRGRQSEAFFYNESGKDKMLDLLKAQ